MREINTVLRMMKDRGHDVEAVAFTGNSGAGVGFPLFMEYGWPIICVRKEGISSHGLVIEATDGKYKRYVVLDDVIASCSTALYIVGKINTYHFRRETQCLAILLYDDPAPKYDTISKYQGAAPDMDIPIFSTEGVLHGKNNDLQRLRKQVVQQERRPEHCEDEGREVVTLPELSAAYETTPKTSGTGYVARASKFWLREVCGQVKVH